ncbi:NADH-quinone oxidoreductase subunit C [Streptacidiphilus sp. PB12-B1b]|nr:NADH-quinone oxidoreductase subunit C [Streptacidiphilus sp. PB12-B1b]
MGPWATAEHAFALLTVDVPAEHWTEALTAARDRLGLAFFDWLSAVDELAEGFSVVAHLAAVGTGGPLTAVLLRTRVARDAAALPTATGVFAGAAWHERETHEMFGIDFTGHPDLATLLLPEGFEGYPLRKEFVLAARVAKAWPGAKEPGESDHPGEGGAPAARRRMLPPGVPDPNEWGPLAGTLPPVPERPARGAGRGPRAAAAAEGAAAAAAGERPVRADRPRRTRSVDQGSASQAAPAAPAPAAAPEAPPAPTPDAPWQLPTPEPPPAEPPAGPAAEPPAEPPAAPSQDAAGEGGDDPQPTGDDA